MAICGAKRRDGGRCQRYPLRGKRRCQKHGGRLIGGSIHRDTSKARATRLARWELRKALGLPYGAGKRRKVLVPIGAVATAGTMLMAEIEKLQTLVADGELGVELTEAARAGVRQLHAIITQPLDMENLKQQRLVGDMALAAMRLLARVQEAQFRHQHQDRVMEVLERIAAERLLVEDKR